MVCRFWSSQSGAWWPEQERLSNVGDEQFENLAKWAHENAVSLPQPVGPEPADAAPPALPDTPTAWFSAKFPNLEKRYGPALQEVVPPGEDKWQPYVKDVSEDFLAATL